MNPALLSVVRRQSKDTPPPPPPSTQRRFGSQLLPRGATPGTPRGSGRWAGSRADRPWESLSRDHTRTLLGAAAQAAATPATYLVGKAVGGGLHELAKAGQGGEPDPLLLDAAVRFNQKHRVLTTNATALLGVLRHDGDPTSARASLAFGTELGEVRHRVTRSALECHAVLHGHTQCPSSTPRTLSCCSVHC